MHADGVVQPARGLVRRGQAVPAAQRLGMRRAEHPRRGVQHGQPVGGGRAADVGRSARLSPGAQQYRMGLRGSTAGPRRVAQPGAAVAQRLGQPRAAGRGPATPGTARRPRTRTARSNSAAGMTFPVSACISGCTWTVRVVLAGLMVTSPARARLCTASRAWAGSAGMAGCPVMYPHAAWLVNTTPGMPAGSSSAASASIGRANPAGGIWSARSMARTRSRRPRPRLRSRRQRAPAHPPLRSRNQPR